MAVRFHTPHYAIIFVFLEIFCYCIQYLIFLCSLKREGTGTKGHPTMVCGIVTGDSPVSYWSIFPLSLVTIPEVFAKVNSTQFPSLLLSGECCSQFFFHLPTPEGAREDHSRGEVEGRAERRDTSRMRLILLFFLQQGQNNLPKLLHYDLCEAVSWVQREGRDQCFHLRFSVFTHTRWKGLQRIISWSISNFNVNLVLLAFLQPNMIKRT